MKISYTWLQNFFESKLPDAKGVADALTFHAFEIESVMDDVLDVKVTPNRGHDCLSHRGIAKELSAILKFPLNKERDPYAHTPDLSKKTDAIIVSLESNLCKRYIAGYITGVKIGPSPDWLRNSLESLGQRSINNVVDATNLVMFNTGQPLHAFDAGKLSKKEGKYAIAVRMAKKDEHMVGLDDKEYTFAGSELLITDGHNETPIGIAGIKGGAPSGIDNDTTDIILESANFDGVSVRRSATGLKLKTDASDRFQQVISPELAAYGMQQAVDLIAAIASGKLQGFADVYPAPQRPWTVSVSLEKINRVLGTRLAEAEVAGVFSRFGFAYEQKAGTFSVTPPFERLDLVIPEDLIEEVGRIVGYDKIPSEELPQFKGEVEVNKRFAAGESRREELMAKSYSEVFTSVFADKGERIIANKVDGVRPYLRSTLVDGLKDAYEKNNRNKDLLGLREVRLFEIGVVWKSTEERVMLGTADSSGVREELLDKDASELSPRYENLPASTTVKYRTFSRYPFIVRDIAMWVPTTTKPEDVLAVIRTHAGELLVQSEKFDEFTKGERMSFAFRLVFQSSDRTLTDEDANERMESIYDAVKTRGWEVR